MVLVKQRFVIESVKCCQLHEQNRVRNYDLNKSLQTLESKRERERNKQLHKTSNLEKSKTQTWTKLNPLSLNFSQTHFWPVSVSVSVFCSTSYNLEHLSLLGQSISFLGHLSFHKNGVFVLNHLRFIDFAVHQASFFFSSIVTILASENAIGWVRILESHDPSPGSVSVSFFFRY